MASETAKTQPEVRVISCAWGDAHIDDFLNYCLPALLAPNNLAALCEKFPVEMVFLTEEAQFDRIARHPVWQRMNRLCPARLVSLDDLLVGPDSYGMSLTQALHRGFADLGPTMTKNWQVFFNSDFIVADGSLARLAEAMREGHRLILSPSYCVNEEPAKLILDDAREPDRQRIAIPRRAMADIMLRHRHMTVASKIVNHGLFSFLYTDQFYRMVDDYTLIGRQMPIAMVALMPERYLPAPTTYWDYGVVADFVPNTPPHVLGDSDDFLMIELRSTKRSEEALVLGPRSQADLSASLAIFASRETVKIANHRLVVHSRDLPGEIEQEQKTLDEFVRQVVEGAKDLPSGTGHFQWMHHFDRFREAQQRFQAAKMAERNSVFGDRDLSHRYTPPLRLFPLVEGAPMDLAPPAKSNSSARAANGAGAGQPPELGRAVCRLVDIAGSAGPLSNAKAIDLVARFTDLVEIVRRDMASTETGGDFTSLRTRLRWYVTSPERTMADILTALSAALAEWLALLRLCQRVAQISYQSEPGRPLRDLLQLQTELAHALTDAVPDNRQDAERASTARVNYLLWRAATVLVDRNIRPISEAASERDLGDATGLVSEAVSMLLSADAAGPELDATYVQKLAGAAISVDGFDYAVLGALFSRCVRQIYTGTFSEDFPWSSCGTEPGGTATGSSNRSDELVLDSAYEILAILRDAANSLSAGETADRLAADAMLRFLEQYDPTATPSGLLALPLTTTGSGRNWLKETKKILSLSSRPYLEIATRPQFRRLLAEHGGLSQARALIVDNGASALHATTLAACQKYWLPLDIVDGVAFSLLRQHMERQIDLCIVALPFDDIAKFTAIYGAVEPMMNPGGKVVLYSLNPNGTGLPSSDPVLIRGLFPVAGMARIVYSGSLPAIWVLRLRHCVERLVEGAGSSRLRIEFVRMLHLGLRLFSGYAGWHEALQHQKNTPPKNVMSICLEVSVP